MIDDEKPQPQQPTMPAGLSRKPFLTPMPPGEPLPKLLSAQETVTLDEIPAWARRRV